MEGFDLFAALTAHRDFVQSGGHPMAAGLSLAGTDIERLRELLKEEALRTLGLPEAGRLSSRWRLRWGTGFDREAFAPERWRS